MTGAVLHQDIESRFPWHRDIWSRLCVAQAGDRLPHALLLDGRPGTGRNGLAKRFARLLLCLQPAADRHCGACKSCRLDLDGSHADFLSIEPLEAGKRIGIDAIRALQAFAVKTPSLGRRKVILVSPLDAFTENAFNAFLKGLEEPAAGTFLLLVAARGQRIPATIRSRCQRLELPEPEPDEAVAWLEEQGLGEPAAAARLAPRQPLWVLETLASDRAGPLLELHEALEDLPAGVPLASLISLASAVDSTADLLDCVEAVLHRRATALARDGDRHVLRSCLETTARIQYWRDALNAGTNPNPDLLRFDVLDRTSRIWERRDSSARLATELNTLSTGGRL